MTPSLKNKQQKETVVFIKEFFLFLDFLPVVKKTSFVSGRARLGHTLIGCSLLLLFQLSPFFGLYFITRPVQMNLLFANQHNLTDLARGVVITAPIFYNVLSNMFNTREFQFHKKNIIRGIRNLSILIGVFVRLPYLLIHVQLGYQAIPLYPDNYLALILVVYVIQNLISTFAILWVEEYLEECGIEGYNILIYYQLIDLFIQIKTNATPGDLNWVRVVYVTLIVLTLFFQDFFYTEEVKIVHVQSVQTSKTMKYHMSQLISTTSMLHTMIKYAIENSIILLYNPLTSWTQSKVLGRSRVDYLVPEWVSQNIFFTGAYYYYYYLPDKNTPLAWSILTSLYFDFLLYLLVLYNIDQLDPQFNYLNVTERLSQARNKVYETQGKGNTLKVKLSRLKWNGMWIGGSTFILFSLIPVYGGVLKSVDLAYYFSRVSSLPDLIKNESELPEYLEQIKHHL